MSSSISMLFIETYYYCYYYYLFIVWVLLTLYFNFLTGNFGEFVFLIATETESDDSSSLCYEPDGNESNSTC